MLPIETDAASPAISVKDVSKRFGTFTAVRDLSFDVAPGEIFGLLGPNGSGKTTTINMLVGLSEPSDGAVHIFGLDPRHQPLKARRLLGVVAQETALYEELTAERNLRFHAELFQIPRADRAQRIREMLALAQLEERARSRVSTFSGGMKRRLAIVRALLHDPKIICLDEPTLGVDVQARRIIWDYVLQMKARGRTVLITTNYLEEAQALCDRLAIVDHGSLVALDTPRRLQRRFGTQIIEVDWGEEAPAEALGALRAISGVRSVHTDGGQSAALTLASGEGSEHVQEAVLPQVMEALRRHSLTVRHLNLREPTLDEVFLSLTGRGLRD